MKNIELIETINNLISNSKRKNEVRSEMIATIMDKTSMGMYKGDVMELINNVEIKLTPLQKSLIKQYNLTKYDTTSSRKQNILGVSFPDADNIIFDEFIEKNDKKTKAKRKTKGTRGGKKNA